MVVDLSKLHITKLAEKRIIHNLELEEGVNPLEHCIEGCRKRNSTIERGGKFYYIAVPEWKEIYTVNTSSMAIITAHKITGEKRYDNRL